MTILQSADATSGPEPPNSRAPAGRPVEPSLALDLVASGAAVLVGRLPWRVALRAGDLLGLAVWASARRKRSRTRDNLRRAGVAAPELAARQAWRQQGRTLAEMLWITGRRPDAVFRHVAVEGLDALREAGRDGRGVLLVSGHVGNWELVAISAAKAGLPVAVVARRLRTPRLERRLVAFRERGGVRTLVRGRPGASVAASRWMARGGVLGCMMDRLSRGPRIAVPFLGAATNMPLGPLELAVRWKAAVVLGSARRCEDSSTRVTFRRVPTGEVDEPADLARVVGRALEAEIRTRPEQWLWIYRRQPSWEGLSGTKPEAGDRVRSRSA